MGHAQFVLATRPYFMNMHGTMHLLCCITAAARKSVMAFTKKLTDIKTNNDKLIYVLGQKHTNTM